MEKNKTIQHMTNTTLIIIDKENTCTMNYNTTLQHYNTKIYITIQLKKYIKKITT